MTFRERAGEYVRILNLVWPIALGMANNAVMQFVDRVFLAHESAAALEAVLPAAMLSFTLIAFFQSTVAYSGTFVAQYHGARDRAGCVRSFRAALLLSLASTVFLVAAVPLGLLCFDWIGHSPEVIAREKAYYSIVTPGGLALCLSMAGGSYFTGLGRTRPVFWVNVLGNAFNIALDPLLIFGWGPFPRWGMAGAAAATVAAQTVQAAVLCAMAWRETRGRGPDVPVEPGTEPADTLRSILWKIVRYGVPTGVHAVLNNLSFTVFVFLTGTVGDMAFAASNAVFTVNYLLYAPMEGFGVGAGVLVGQRMGAGDVHGAARAGTRTAALGVAYSMLTCGIVLLFHRPILALFLAHDVPFETEAFQSLGFRLFILMALWQCFDALEVVVSGALKGAGDTRFVMWWMLFMAFVFWMPVLGVTYRLYPTLEALWWTMLVYVIVFAAGTIFRWVRGPWRHIRLIA